MTEQSTEVAAVLADLDHATSLVAELRASISSGESVDLATFNSHIESACNAAIALPRDQMPEVRDSLDNLLQSLNGARDEIETARAELAAEEKAEAEATG